MSLADTIPRPAREPDENLSTFGLSAVAENQKVETAWLAGEAIRKTRSPPYRHSALGLVQRRYNRFDRNDDAQLHCHTYSFAPRDREPGLFGELSRRRRRPKPSPVSRLSRSMLMDGMPLRGIVRPTAATLSDHRATRRHMGQALRPE